MKRSQLRYWIAACLVASHCACNYKLDEAASRIPLSVNWSSEYASVECCRFTERQSAQEYFERRGEASKCRDVIVLNSSGDLLRITRLTSGFNSTRLLHSYLVFDLYTSDGKSRRLLVKVTDDIMSKRKIDLNSVNGENALH